jgi:hypothetical protein
MGCGGECIITVVGASMVPFGAPLKALCAINWRQDKDRPPKRKDKSNENKF